MTNKSLIICLVIYSLPAFSYADNPTQQNLVKKIIEASGMETMIESFPDQIVAQHMHRMSITKHPEIEQKVTNIILESYDKEKEKQILVDSVTKNASRQELKAIEDWLQSPLGRKFTSAESKASDPKSGKALLAYIDKIQNDPPPQERVLLIKRFEKSARQTEAAVKIVELITRGILSDLNEFYAAEGTNSAEDINKQIHEMNISLPKSIRPNMILVSQYTYREFTNAEIEKYIDFLESDTGRKYIDIAITGYSDVLSDFLKSAIPKIKQAATTRGSEQKAM